MNRNIAAILVIVSLLVIDQLVKVYIKTNIPYGGGFDIFGLEWAKIHFIENKGMAFGLSFGGEIGKYVLSVFRIFMVGFLFYLLRNMIKSNESWGLIISFSMIVAGAIGNILDSMFYGLIFTQSSYHGGLAQFVPFGTGYAPFLQGSVVDMFYFPMIDTILPEWFPIWGGERFEFFRPVFNVADACISVGVFSILIFYRRLFFNSDKKEEVTTTVTTENE